jgi:GNAT superfamily N-acetyltransferase
MSDPVEYRLLRPNEEEKVLHFWLSVFEDTDLDQWRREFGWDARRFERTLIAVREGEILSTARYSVQAMRDSEGSARKIAYVSNIGTKENERGKGYAGDLLTRLIVLMKEEGCEWSILNAEDTRLYERYGWKAYPYTFRQGSLRPEPIEPSDRYKALQLALTDDDYRTLAELYARYNQKRPLTTVRGEDYWQTYWQARVEEWRRSAFAQVLLVLEHTEPCGYMIAHPAPHGLLITELAVFPEHIEAVTRLFHEAHRQTLLLGGKGGRVFLPNEPALNKYLVQMLSDLHIDHDVYIMARPITGDMAEIDGAFHASGAMIWLIDSF